MWCLPCTQRGEKIFFFLPCGLSRRLHERTADNQECISLHYHAAALSSARESNAAQIQDLQVYPCIQIHCTDTRRKVLWKKGTCNHAATANAECQYLHMFISDPLKYFYHCTGLDIASSSLPSVQALWDQWGGLAGGKKAGGPWATQWSATVSECPLLTEYCTQSPKAGVNTCTILS